MPLVYAKNVVSVEQLIQNAMEGARKYTKGLDQRWLNQAATSVNSLRAHYAVMKKKNNNDRYLDKFHTYLLEVLVKASIAISDLYNFPREEVLAEAEHYMKKARILYRANNLKNMRRSKVTPIKTTDFFRSEKFTELELVVTNDN